MRGNVTLQSLKEFDRNKAFGAPSVKVSNNIKKFIGRPTASRHVMHVILRAMLFLSGNHYHTKLYFLECRDSPRIFSFQFPLCTSGETDFLVSTLI